MGELGSRRWWKTLESCQSLKNYHKYTTCSLNSTFSFRVGRPTGSALENKLWGGEKTMQKSLYLALSISYPFCPKRLRRYFNKGEELLV